MIAQLFLLVACREIDFKTSNKSYQVLKVALQILERKFHKNTKESSLYS